MSISNIISSNRIFRPHCSYTNTNSNHSYQSLVQSWQFAATSIQLIRKICTSVKWKPRVKTFCFFHPDWMHIQACNNQCRILWVNSSSYFFRIAIWREKILMALVFGSRLPCSLKDLLIWVNKKGWTKDWTMMSVLNEKRDSRPSWDAPISLARWDVT